MPAQMQNHSIPLVETAITRADRANIDRALTMGDLAGPGAYTKSCDAWLEARTGVHALTVNSGTSALELCCLLADLQPGDEVILPSFVSPSMANAVVLRNAVPVFADIEPTTLNIDPEGLEDAITERTRAIFVMHYAGVACAMGKIMALAKHHELLVLENGAHAICADYHGHPLCAIGNFGALSFHAARAITCGRGGALLIRDADDFARSRILCDEGTNGAADLQVGPGTYSWQGVGTISRPSEILAALLAAQLSRADAVAAACREIWGRYHEALANYEEEGLLRRPMVPEGCHHNGYIYYILLPTEEERDRAMADLKAEGIGAAVHYAPLHLAPAGRKFGRASGSLKTTCDVAGRLLRLPLFPSMKASDQACVIDTLGRVLAARRGRSVA